MKAWGAGSRAPFEDPTASSVKAYMIGSSDFLRRHCELVGEFDSAEREETKLFRRGHVSGFGRFIEHIEGGGHAVEVSDQPQFVIYFGHDFWQGWRPRTAEVWAN
ncbi:MAG: hypothetical protein ABSB82_24405 [Terriglobia bacterium]